MAEGILDWGSKNEEKVLLKRDDQQPAQLNHDERGLLSMALASGAAHGFSFRVTFKANRNLDSVSEVFEKLVQGFEVLDKIENAGCENAKLLVPVKIIQCKKKRKKESSIPPSTGPQHGQDFYRFAESLWLV